MSELIDRKALLSKRGELAYCEVCPVWSLIKDAPTVAASAWRSVEDGLPDDSRDVIIITASRIIGVGSFIRPNWYQWYSGGGLPVDVTHWMPIPEPPKEDA